MITHLKFQDGKLKSHQHSRPRKKCKCGGARRKYSKICFRCWADNNAAIHPFIGSIKSILGGTNNAPTI